MNGITPSNAGPVRARQSRSSAKLLAALTALLLAPPSPERAAGADGVRLANAAQRPNGARVTFVTAKGGSQDPNTPPEATFDSDVHTRCVVRGAPPYTFTIDLPFRVPVSRLAFAHSDYASERAPKDIEIALDDGAVLRHTLELKRPAGRKPAWQEVAVGKEAKTIKVTVLSDHEPSDRVNWGGLAEIAVLTPVALDEKFAVPGHDAAAPTFVHVPPLDSAGAARVHLPPVAPAGEHPRLLLTRQEVAQLRADLPKIERGRQALPR